MPTRVSFAQAFGRTRRESRFRRNGWRVCTGRLWRCCSNPSATAAAPFGTTARPAATWARFRTVFACTAERGRSAFPADGLWRRGAWREECPCGAQGVRSAERRSAKETGGQAQRQDSGPGAECAAQRRPRRSRELRFRAQGREKRRRTRAQARPPGCRKIRKADGTDAPWPSARAFPPAFSWESCAARGACPRCGASRLRPS